MNRSPDRIEPTLDKIREIWYRNPDLRLTQLLENVAIRGTVRTSPAQFEEMTIGEQYIKLMDAESQHSCCMYGMEEDELLRRLHETYG